MSRLDQHVAAVQNKLALDKFLDALAKTAAGFAAVCWVAILVDKMFQLRLPRVDVWFYAGCGAAVVAAVAWAIWRRPGALDAAVRIDEVLNTKDKFATALHVRTMSDPFAHAALLDAERTANDVSLHKRFPLSFPKFSYVTVGVALLALATFWWMKPMDLFGREEARKKQLEAVTRTEQATKTIQNALSVVAAVPPALQENEQIKLAKESLLNQLSNPARDPADARRTAAKALQDVNEAIKEQVKQNQKYADAQNEAKMMRTLQVPADEKGPVADAHRAIAKGDFNQAVMDLQKVTENFEKMQKEDQEKAAEQMKNMANQLKQMAQDPQQQKKMEDQLKQMGANQQQAEQMAKEMQKAAQGDQQAQQNLQQMAQQIQQQMNNGQGPNQQQQQQIQQMMQQMQAQANAQQQAQQMQQAAQQMAQAMQQVAQQGQQQQGQQGQKGQGQPQQQQGQQMAQGMQQMQQQLQQMQGQAQDAQQIAAAQRAAAQGAQDAMNGMNGQQGQEGDQQGGGQWAGGQQPGGDPNQPWDGQAQDGMMPGGGQGAGDRSAKEQAPYAIKPEISPSIDNDKGKIIASTLIKDQAIKGEAREQLKEVLEAAQKNAADEIDQDRVSRQAQRVVRDYFNSMQQSAADAPTTQPAK